jgi:competence protein ComEC
VGEIWVGTQPAADSEMAELIRRADRFDVEVKQVGRGEVFEAAGVTIEIFWPERSPDQLGSDNNSSLVIRLTYGETKLLFTGDIEKEAEGLLTREGNSLDADLIKVPHHGSRTSSTQQFVDAVSPKFAIIPVGRRSLYGHPHREVVERWRGSGADVRTTGEKGTITVVSNGRELKLNTYHE